MGKIKITNGYNYTVLIPEDEEIIETKGKVYAASDFHGCADPALKILDYLGPDDTLIYLGDAIDRGSDSKRVLDALLSDSRVIFLKGNHEDMMADAIPQYIDGCGITFNWIMNGGDETFKEFECLSDQILMGYVGKIRHMPTEVTYFSSKGHRVILEHAGYTPFDTPHRSYDPLWDREHFYDEWDGSWGYEKNSEVDTTYLVHGHTPVQYLEYRYGYRGQESTKERLIYQKAWNDCSYEVMPKPEVIKYCDGHKFDIDLCTVVSDRVALLNLDTFDIKYFDKENE